MQSDQISVDKCRALLGDASSSLADEDVETIRDQLYTLARIVVDAYDCYRAFDPLSVNPSPEQIARMEQVFRSFGWDVKEDDKEWNGIDSSVEGY